MQWVNPSCLLSLDYMLPPFVECLWYLRFWHLCLRQEDLLIKWTTKRQTVVLRINVLRYNRFMFRQWSPFLWKKWTNKLTTSGSYGRLANKIWVDLKIFKILYRLNYWDFYLVNISGSVRSAFQLVFLM